MLWGYRYQTWNMPQASSGDGIAHIFRACLSHLGLYCLVLLLLHKSRWSILWGFWLACLFTYFELELYSVSLLLFVNWFVKCPVSEQFCFNIIDQKFFFNVWKSVSLYRGKLCKREEDWYGVVTLRKSIKTWSLLITSFEKNIAIYFQIHMSLWTEEKAGHPKNIPSYFKFRRIQ